MASYYTIRLNVRVTDPAALFAAALAHAVTVDEMSDADARETLLEEIDEDDTPDEAPVEIDGKTPNISACLQMLLDPGVSPDGCEIQESSVDFDYDGEATDAFL